MSRRCDAFGRLSIPMNHFLGGFTTILQALFFTLLETSLGFKLRRGFHSIRQTQTHPYRYQTLSTLVTLLKFMLPQPSFGRRGGKEKEPSPLLGEEISLGTPRFRYQFLSSSFSRLSQSSRLGDKAASTPSFPLSLIFPSLQSFTLLSLRRSCKIFFRFYP